MSSDPHSWDAALRACDEIEQLLRSATPGADPHAAQRVAFLTGPLGFSASCASKAAKLRHLAPVFFSERRHAGHAGGAEGARREMLAALQWVREEVAHLRQP